MVCTLVIVAGAWFAITRVFGVKPKPATGKYDPNTGLGRGAPGFRMCIRLTTAETNVRRVALPADLVARIRAGEQVSAEEITAAQERVAAGETTPAKPVNEWLPANTTKKAPTARSRRTKK